MKEILKAANFKGFAVSETPRKALRRETCGAPRGGKQRAVYLPEIFRQAWAFPFKRFLQFCSSPQKREGCCFPPVGFSVLRAALVHAARFSVSRSGADMRREKRLPVLRRFGGGGSAPLSRRSQPPPPVACGFSSSGGSVAYSFPEKSLLCKSFSEALLCFVFRIILAAFSRRVLLDCGARVRSAKVCGASVAA